MKKSVEIERAFEAFMAEHKQFLQADPVESAPRFSSNFGVQGSETAYKGVGSAPKGQQFA